MSQVILEIRDGVATGPMHHPVHKKPVNGQGGFLFSNFDTPPLNWEALCGAEGYVYQREPLAALGHTDECSECHAILHAPPPEPKPAPKPRVILPPPTCEDCGARVTDRRSSRCVPCYHAQRPKPVCGTNSSFVSGCRCDACREANRAYHREHKRTLRMLARRRAA